MLTRVETVPSLAQARFWVRNACLPDLHTSYRLTMLDFVQMSRMLFYFFMSFTDL
jgi:hypothetical protein